MGLTEHPYLCILLAFHANQLFYHFQFDSPITNPLTAIPPTIILPVKSLLD